MGGDIALPRALVLALIVISVVGIFGIGLAVGSLIGDSVPPAPTANTDFGRSSAGLHNHAFPRSSDGYNPAPIRHYFRACAPAFSHPNTVVATAPTDYSHTCSGITSKVPHGLRRLLGGYGVQLSYSPRTQRVPC